MRGGLESNVIYVYVYIFCTSVMGAFAQNISIWMSESCVGLSNSGIFTLQYIIYGCLHMNTCVCVCELCVGVCVLHVCAFGMIRNEWIFDSSWAFANIVERKRSICVRCEPSHTLTYVHMLPCMYTNSAYIWVCMLMGLKWHLLYTLFSCFCLDRSLCVALMPFTYRHTEPRHTEMQS